MFDMKRTFEKLIFLLFLVFLRELESKKKAKYAISWKNKVCYFQCLLITCPLIRNFFWEFDLKSAGEKKSVC